ncbi:hypothetical protein D1BOALGB6SA_10625 [Olavius sp. associated proteobacterium Delta 1]|nr:hypothetical protein D1BOALGB6SA_10625 [Olavius sp. associated proteobacterium Delta 1]
MNKVKIDEFIELLQKYELSIAALYETFATILPLTRNEWSNYAGEERLHAKWINVLHGYLKDEKISFEQTKMASQAITTSIDFIERQIQNALESKIDLKQALVFAIDIEESLLESAFLKVFKLNGAKAKKIQARLIEATEAHKNRLIEWQKRIRNA